MRLPTLGWPMVLLSVVQYAALAGVALAVHLLILWVGIKLLYAMGAL